MSTAESAGMIGRVEASAELGRLADRVRSGGLVAPGSSGLVLVSGGADSACAAAAAVGVCGPEHVTALHVNYGLRSESDRDEQTARELCARLRIDLHVDRPKLAEGNVQAAARNARYAAAESLRAKLELDWIATGHTRTDLAETFLYRLAASPGCRALDTMHPRQGRMIRPLHDLAREETRAVALAAALPFADDSSNTDRRFARNLIRADILPALAEVNPAFERNIAATHAELHEEHELLARVVERELERIGAGGAATAVDAGALASMEPAMLRLALRTLAERAAGAQVALGRGKAARIARIASSTEGGEIELGAGLSAICESGIVRFSFDESVGVPEPVRLAIPGAIRYGTWEVRAELVEGAVPPSGPEEATLDAEALGGEVEIRAWRSGDRIAPLGLGGTKTLQDLFTDQRVPRSLRHRLPVLVAGDEVAWVAGVAVSERFKLSPGARATARITARAIGT